VSDPTGASSGVQTWNRFVESAARDVFALDEGIAALAAGAARDDGSAAVAAGAPTETAASLAQRAFRVGLSSLLVGADEVGRLALAIEQALDGVASGGLAIATAATLLAAPREALRQALLQLQNADKSGARVEGLPLVELTRSLLEALPRPASPLPHAGSRAATAAARPHASASARAARGVTLAWRARPRARARRCAWRRPPPHRRWPARGRRGAGRPCRPGRPT